MSWRNLASVAAGLVGLAVLRALHFPALLIDRHAHDLVHGWRRLGLLPRAEAQVRKDLLESMPSTRPQGAHYAPWKNRPDLTARQAAELADIARTNQPLFRAICRSRAEIRPTERAGDLLSWDP